MSIELKLVMISESSRAITVRFSPTEQPEMKEIIIIIHHYKMSAFFRKTAGALCRSGNSALQETFPVMADILRLECSIFKNSKVISQHRWSSMSSHIPGSGETVSLNSLRDNPGATQQVGYLQT
jgi:hypothetical protein